MNRKRQAEEKKNDKATNHNPSRKREGVAPFGR